MLEAKLEQRRRNLKLHDVLFKLIISSIFSLLHSLKAKIISFCFSLKGIDLIKKIEFILSISK